MSTTQTKVLSTDEVLKLALEALEDIRDDCSGCEFEWNNDYPLQAKAHAAIKEALAQPEQEPVAWGMPSAGEGHIVDVITPEEHDRVEGGYTVPLYTTPPQHSAIARSSSATPLTWVGLTDWEINSVANNNNPLDGIRTFARAIEAKLKEKNTNA